MSISFRCGDFVVVWKKFWNHSYLFEVELLQHFLQLRKLAWSARKAFAGRIRLRGVCCAGLLKLTNLQTALKELADKHHRKVRISWNKLLFGNECLFYECICIRFRFFVRFILC